MNNKLLLLNQTLYLLTKWAMSGVVVHFVYTQSPSHVTWLAVLWLAQVSLDLMLSNSVDKITTKLKEERGTQETWTSPNSGQTTGSTETNTTGESDTNSTGTNG